MYIIHKLNIILLYINNRNFSSISEKTLTKFSEDQLVNQLLIMRLAAGTFLKIAVSTKDTQNRSSFCA